MARSYDPIEPMTLANMRENGVRSLDVRCWQCHHETDCDLLRAAHGVHEMRDCRRRC